VVEARIGGILCQQGSGGQKEKQPHAGFDPAGGNVNEGPHPKSSMPCAGTGLKKVRVRPSVGMRANRAACAVEDEVHGIRP
jgi:hypothetical protein